MARTDAIVLGAGIVGTSIALQLSKRGMSVALIDRAAVGEQTSYGNAGVIEFSTTIPPSFPPGLAALMRIAFKRASEANYHMSFLPFVAPWLLAFRAASRLDRVVETARLNRPLFARSISEHEPLMEESDALQYLRKTGWIKLYRSEKAFRSLKPDFELAEKFGLPYDVLDAAGVKKLEPSLNPVFERAVFWPAAASLSNPLAVTRAYSKRFTELGGLTFEGDARSLHRSGAGWRVETARGADRFSQRGGGARPVGTRSAQAARHQIAVRVQARLSPAFPRRGQCGAQSAGGRCRLRLSDHADGAGHPAHHWRGIRPA